MISITRAIEKLRIRVTEMFKIQGSNCWVIRVGIFKSSTEVPFHITAFKSGTQPQKNNEAN